MNATWLEPCPHCKHDVPVSEPAVIVRCGSCAGRFQTSTHPQEAAGADVALDTPTRAVQTKARAPSDPKDSLVGMEMGRWTLLRLIGRGGMGRVYEARDGEKGRRVALKVLSEDLANDRQFVKRFRREAKHLASMSHPHIVNVVDQGKDDDRLWFAMDYVRGESLRRKIEQGPLKPAVAARIASEVATALTYAHDRGIIHRDLKPENVLLDEDGGVHLVDFGLSRLVNTSPGEASTRLTRTDVILGTYEYMAPEQRRGDRMLDGRADIFALGVILYEMLTGTLPLGRFTPPSETSKGISRSFDEIVNRALATSPEARFANAGDFQEALGRALEDKTPTPPPLPRSEEIRPVVPHHRIDEARSVLRHLEVIGALDRVCGVILLIGGLGILPLGALISLPAIAGLSGIIFFIMGLYLMGLGKRVARLEQGARESQVTASVLMLFIPPFFTAFGLYALIVVTTERARSAFRYGLKALRGPSPVFEVLETESVVERRAASHPRPASLLMRGFTLLAIFFSVYVAVVALDVYQTPADRLSDYVAREHDELVVIATVAAAYSLLVLIRGFLVRRQRRGFGLALTAALFLFASAGLLHLSVNDAKHRKSHPEAAAVRFLPGEMFRQNFRQHLQRERSK